MIWVVSGFPRSGTSLMMQALRAGKMDVYFDPEHERKLKQDHPKDNDSFLEVGAVDFKDYYFPLQHEGKAIKLLAPWISIPCLAKGQYRVMLMLRDCREIAVSLARLYGGALPRGDLFLLNRYSHFMDKAFQLALNRRDVASVTVMPYERLLENPLEHFRDIHDSGWPVDPEKAAAVVDPNRQRIKFTGPDDIQPCLELIATIDPNKTRVEELP